MKLFSSVFLLFLISSSLFSQEKMDKKIQVGIVVGGGINFLNIQTTQIRKDNVGGFFTAGMALNWCFSKNVGLSTGLQFDLERFSFQNKSNPTSNEVLYYDYSDRKIFREKENPENNEIFILNKRKQQPIYLTIPTMLLFRTNKIGYFRYFGKFGLRNSFLLTQRTQDYGTSIENGFINQDAENSKMKSKNSMVFFRSSVGIAGGFEWAFSGETSLCFEVGYYYGFTPLFYKKSNRSIYTLNDNLSKTYKSFGMMESQLVFKASILF
jgi:hypothetical protein